MADIEIRRAHELGRVAARRAAEQMVADLARKFDLRGQWQGDVLRFERPGVAGTLALTERDLHLTISLGFLLKAMKASIEKAVLHELDTLFARAAPAPHEPAPAPESAPKRPKGHR
jgi:putative polyhydroxyalkanoate system protein